MTVFLLMFYIREKNTNAGPDFIGAKLRLEIQFGQMKFM